MKREAVGHTKMKRLCRRMDIPTYQAVGILESLWHLTAREAPRGDIGKLSDEDIALGLDYRGDETKLIGALTEAGWLDAHKTVRLIVHDWSEHADDAVNMKLARSHEYFCDGKKPSYTRIGGKEREKIVNFYENGRPCARIDESCAPPDPSPPPPEPEPEPEPEPGPTSDEVSARAALELVRAAPAYIPPPPKVRVGFAGEDLFEELYSAHPKKSYRGMAQTLLAESVGAGADPEEIRRVHRLCCAVWKKDRNPEIASGTLAQWLIDQGWRYPPEPATTDSPPGKLGASSRLSVLDRLKPRSG